MIEGQQEGRTKAIQINRQKKSDTIEYYRKEGIQSIGTLSPRELLVAGVGLYWGEGSKKGKLSFINSDPTLILFMYTWFRRVFLLKKEDFMPRIFINHSHKDRVDTVVDFWAKKLNLPQSQFGKVTLLKMSQKKKYLNRDTYYGVLALRIRKGTYKLYRMLGLIEGLKRGI